MGGQVLEQVQNLFQYLTTLNLTHLECSDLDDSQLSAEHKIIKIRAL